MRLAARHSAGQCKTVLHCMLFRRNMGQSRIEAEGVLIRYLSIDRILSST
jgi:hypothetical protein